MIYKLDTDFSKIEQEDGLMQNLSHQAYVEVVSCVEDPRKDSGIILLPLEKINFKAKKGESVFARSAHIGGTPANISVVNFNVPASDGSGAGVGSITYGHTVLDGYVKADGLLLQRDDYPELFRYACENSLILSEDDWVNGMQGMFAEGDGVNTFRVPDLRGQFLRGLDDIGGIDSARALGSQQEDAIRNITGGGATCFNTATGETLFGAFYKIPTTGVCGNPNAGFYAYNVNFDASRIVPTAEENRPKNIALIAQIKY